MSLGDGDPMVALAKNRHIAAFMKNLVDDLANMWNATSFASEEVSFYARKLTVDETRKGLVVLSIILLCLFGLDIFLFDQFGFSREATYTCGLLALLSAHILISAPTAKDTASLYLLGTTLLMISGAAFDMLARSSSGFSPGGGYAARAYPGAFGRHRRFESGRPRLLGLSYR